MRHQILHIQYSNSIRRAPQCLQAHWGEPERAPHISITFHVRLSSLSTSVAVDPITVYLRGKPEYCARPRRILHDRIWKYCAAPPARALDPAGLAYELTAQAAWILLAQSMSAVPQSAQAECARCCRDKYALKVRSSSDLPPQLHVGV